MKKLAFLVLMTVIGFCSSSYGQTEQVQQARLASTSYMEGLASDEPLPALPQSPLYLTGTTPEQLTPDYFINRLPDPHPLP